MGVLSTLWPSVRWGEVKLPKVTGQDVDLGLQISALEAWLEWQREEEEAVTDINKRKLMCQMEGNKLEENHMLPTGEGKFALKSWDEVIILECIDSGYLSSHTR